MIGHADLFGREISLIRTKAQSEYAGLKLDARVLVIIYDKGPEPVSIARVAHYARIEPHDMQGAVLRLWHSGWIRGLGKEGRCTHLALTDKGQQLRAAIGGAL